MSFINTIVFDIGNVLLNWDPRHVYRNVFESEEKMEWFLTDVCSSSWNEEQDRGRSWADAEAEAISRHPEQENNIKLFRARWSEMIPTAIEGTVSLKSRLINADILQYAITNFATDTWKEAQELYPFLTEFEGIVVSGDEKLLKPDPAIYKILFDRYGVDPSSAVFIDDKMDNVEAAKKTGMTGIHFQTPQQLERDLKALGFSF
ncbi:MAG: HAD family phosphatase [Cohaesibacteraceae bacterium]|nr:HAD family phosphatase [Cohaesibacteraceae bacterium]